MKLYLNSVSASLFLYRKVFSNIFVFQTGQHFNQIKLVMSERYLSLLGCMPVLIQLPCINIAYNNSIVIIILLSCIQTDLFLSVPARIINKTGLNFPFLNCLHKLRLVL